MRDKKQMREHQEVIKDEVRRITGLPQSACWGLAGKWLKLYGPTSTKSILSQIPDGKGVAYCEGTFRREISQSQTASSSPILNELTKRWAGE